MTRPRPTPHAWPPSDTGQCSRCGEYPLGLDGHAFVSDESKVTCGRTK